MKTTIKEVAREAGVSISTVSRVLNGKDKVKKETKQKVEKAIKNLDYLPDHIARSMVMKRTKSIGLVVPVISNQYWALLSENIEEQLGKAGYTLMLFITGEGEEAHDKEASILNTMLERHVDGIIYASGRNQAYLKRLLNYGIPTVSFQTNVSGVTRVSGDDLRGGMEATEHLIRLGHEKIAFIGGSPKSVERELGYRNAHTVNHLLVNESLVRQHTNFTVGCGYEAAKSFLDHKENFSAVFCANDLLAFGAIQAFQNEGLNIPGDIAVVGYDDIESAGFFKPALTTVRQPIREMGMTLAKLVLESIEQTEDSKSTYKNLVFPTELIIRESCGEKALLGSKGQ